jgi:hypothetical protein
VKVSKLNIAIALALVSVVGVSIYKATISDNSKSEGVEVKEFVERVRSEIETLENTKLVSNQRSNFKTDSVNLEINCIIERADSNDSYKLVTVGEKGEVNPHRIQKITLQISALPANGTTESTDPVPQDTKPTGTPDDKIPPSKVGNGS